MEFKPLQSLSPARPVPGAARWYRWLHVGGLGLLAATAGMVAFNVDLPSAAYPWSVAQGFLFAAACLAIGLRACRTRPHVLVLLLGWYLGSLAAMPFTWHAFFSTGWGWLVWVVLATLLALPSLLAPRRWPAFGFLSAAVLASVPPLGFVGLGNPLMVAGALFPGARWFGLLLCLGFFALSALRSRAAAIAQMVMLGFGLLVLTRPPPAPPAYVWAATTFDGLYPEQSLAESFKRQDGAMATVRTALNQGARLVVMPETTDPLWDDGQAFYWGGVTRLAVHDKAQVIIGIYTNPMSTTEPIDGLLDLSSGKIYPAMIAMPLAMWRPWSGNSFPLHLAATAPIPTAAGPAAHLICYEELLVWPLAAQEIHTRPTLLLSAANQWFAGGWLARAQSRSVAMQARLWGLPLVRAVNHHARSFRSSKQ